MTRVWTFEPLWTNITPDPALVFVHRTKPSAFLFYVPSQVVYVHSKPEVVAHKFATWQARFSPLGKAVVQLTGDATVDTKLLDDADITLASAEHWDMMSRRWKQRKGVQKTALFIVDDLHLIGSQGGATLEMVVSRMRLFPFEMDKKIRILGLAACVANAKDLGDWIGASSHGLFSFRPDVAGVRPVPLEIHLQGFEIAHFSSRMLAMAKPVYNAVSAHGRGNKPALIVVPSRKQAQLTAIDLITYAAAAGKGDQFIHADEKQVESFVSGIRDAALKDTLAKGVAFLYPGMHESDRRSVWSLYEQEIIQVVVVPHTLTWTLTHPAHIVVVMGTEFYEGREHRYVDYAITDLLQMMGLASRQGKDKKGLCLVLCNSTKKKFLRKLLDEPLPVESHLNHLLHDHMNAEVVNKTVESEHDALQILTWTFFYRRLQQNPNYYNLRRVGTRELSEYLSDLVESVIEDLSKAKMLEVEEETKVLPLNLGMIAAYHYVQYTSVELFASSVTAKTKVKGMLEILASASEYATLPIRQGEERVLQQLALRLPQKLPEGAKFDEAHIKALLLLQAHFSRTPLPTELKADQRLVVGEAPRLLQALVDVVSSECWLKPCITAMELCQMVVQGLWDKDSYLMQVPHFDTDMVKRCEGFGEEGVEGVLGILELEEGDRDSLLQLPPAKMADVARFCNAYPNIDVSYEVENEDEVVAGRNMSIRVALEREVDEEDEEAIESVGKVVAPHFPKPKQESWWLIVGNPAENSLLFNKRVNSLSKRSKTKLTFPAPSKPGEYNLKLYFICDSYMGADQEYDVTVTVAPGEDSSDEGSDAEAMDTA